LYNTWRIINTHIFPTTPNILDILDFWQRENNFQE
jgi:hypothetical protein